MRQVFGISAARSTVSARKIIEDFRTTGSCSTSCELYAALRLPGGELSLGRYEAPLPIGPATPDASDAFHSRRPKICATPVADAAPTPEEVVEIMRFHAGRETEKPVFSFGQGCEGGLPLTESAAAHQSVALPRGRRAHGTINLNSNSRPQAIAELAEAGLTSLRVASTAPVPKCTKGTTARTLHVRRCAAVHHRGSFARVHVAVNLLYLVNHGYGRGNRSPHRTVPVHRHQSCTLRNLNIDPEFYPRCSKDFVPARPWLNNFASASGGPVRGSRAMAFNPYLGDKADLGIRPCHE